MARYWGHAMVRAWVQTKAPRSVRQRVPALALASAPYLVPLLARVMVLYLDLETARAREQTMAPRSEQQKEPASVLASEPYSVPP